MWRFTIKEMLLATTLIALGLAGLLIPHHMGLAFETAGPAVRTIAGILWLASGPLIGAGLFLPSRQPWDGAIIGFMFQWIALLLIPVVH